MAVQVEPVRVSPFIKVKFLTGITPILHAFQTLTLPGHFLAPNLFPLWAALGAGILYGISKFETFSRIQKNRRDAYEKERPQREAKEKLERETAYLAEMKMLEEAIGSKVV